MKIIDFDEKHLDDIANLEIECFSIPWSREMFEEELKSNLAYYFVAVEEEKIIGYAGMWKILDEGHITNIAVSPDYRRKHIGQKLLDKLISLARAKQLTLLMLEVRKSNTAAKQMYTKHGFVEAGLRKGYYHDNNEDAILMNLVLMEE